MLLAHPSDFELPPPPPQPPPFTDNSTTVNHAPAINKISSSIDKVPSVPSPPPSSQPHQDSPIHYSLAAEENVLGLEEDVLGFTTTHFPPGSLSLECAGATLPCVVENLDLHEDAWTTEVRVQLPQPSSIQDSLVHIVGRPRVCRIFGINTRVCTFTPTEDRPRHGLCDSGANLCVTNNPNLLVNVQPCEPFTISLVTSVGGHSHRNICSSHGVADVAEW